MSDQYINQDAVNQIVSGLEQGIVSVEEVEALNKAITAGYGGAGKPTDLTYGGVLQAESLESTLKSVTFDMKNLKMWPAISVDKAYNLFEQYNRLIGYGSDASPYIGEGGAPQESDSTYIRDGQRIVFFGTRRKVSHQMTLVRTTVGDIVAQQAKEGTMDLLKNVEREMYWGHSHFANGSTGLQNGALSDLPANSIAMNGLLQQLVKGDDDAQQKSKDFEGYGEVRSIVKDLDGAVLTQDDLEDLAVIALENFGSPSELHIEPLALSSFIKQFYPQFRSAPGQQGQTVGYDVNKMVTSAGTIDFKPNLFLRPRSRTRSVGVLNAPALGSAAAIASKVAGSAGQKGLAAGVYQYKLTFVNDFGESGAIQATAGAAATAGQVTVLTLSNIPSGTKHIKVYRSQADGAVGTEAFIGNYKPAATIVDSNAKEPGLGESFLLDMSAECMRFKQLAPLSKINFAIVTTALEFAIVLYGALFVYTPRFNCVFGNMGK
jgi:hypothetical protein